MKEKLFESVAVTKDNPIYEKMIKRERPLYNHESEVRSDFMRDYTRLLNSLAYSRLKHKTQVFFNIENDHICTRMEHVAYVESVSNTIASFLGLNTELTRAIATAHDFGHAPFGHHGENVISEISKKYLGKIFYHEENGLRFVDDLELLRDSNNIYQNLNLTYAVRDGIISHCGETLKKSLFPRKDLIDLKDFKKPNMFEPATWEGCVVKVADKIAYLGRDIEDAIRLNFLSEEDMEKLKSIAEENGESAINTTIIMHNMINDICLNSSPEKGIAFSDKCLKQIKEIKEFNYKNIYYNKRLDQFKHYSELIIKELFNVLKDTYKKEKTLVEIEKQIKYYPKLMKEFLEWLIRYINLNEFEIPESIKENVNKNYDNKKVYGSLENEKIFIQAVIDYISGMTDKYAIKVFRELLTY